MEYYWNDDHTAIGVLVSRGYGAGWSTWNTPELAYRREIVEFWKQYENKPVALAKISTIESSPERREAVRFFRELGYTEENLPYFGGFAKICFEWVPVDTYWRIIEYDGNERVEILDLSTFNYVKGEE